MSPLQGVAAVYMQCGYNEVVVRSSRVNVFKAHQVFVLSGEKECDINREIDYNNNHSP